MYSDFRKYFHVLYVVLTTKLIKFVPDGSTYKMHAQLAGKKEIAGGSSCQIFALELGKHLIKILYENFMHLI